MLHNELVGMDDGECGNRTYRYIGETPREQIYSLSDKRKSRKIRYFCNRNKTEMSKTRQGVRLPDCASFVVDSRNSLVEINYKSGDVFCLIRSRS